MCAQQVSERAHSNRPLVALHACAMGRNEASRARIVWPDAAAVAEWARQQVSDVSICLRARAQPKQSAVDDWAELGAKKVIRMHYLWSPIGRAAPLAVPFGRRLTPLRARARNLTCTCCSERAAAAIAQMRRPNLLVRPTRPTTARPLAAAAGATFIFCARSQFGPLRRALICCRRRLLRRRSNQVSRERCRCHCAPLSERTRKTTTTTTTAQSERKTTQTKRMMSRIQSGSHSCARAAAAVAF